MRRYFQWLVGDDMGKVCELLDITQEDGEYFYNFVDGESCNLSYICPATNDKNQLRGKAMVEVPGPHNCWKFEEVKMGSFTTAENEHVDVPPLQDIIGMSTDNTLDQSALGTMSLTPPKSNPIKGMPLPDIMDYLRDTDPKPVKRNTASGVKVTVQETKESETPVESAKSEEKQPEVQQFIPQPKKEIPNDPVHILVSTCKKHSSFVDLKMELSLPSVTTYNFAKSEFEDGENKFIEAICDNISTETIMTALRKALHDAYESQKTEA